MSLLPYIFDDPWQQARSRRAVNPYWGAANPVEEVIRPVLGALAQWPNWSDVQSQLANIDRDSTIQLDKDKFQASIDVQQFKPEEISVKLTGDRTVTIEGKHEEKQDEHGYISRHFVRRYVLPDNCDVQGLQSKLSSDGVLTIVAPKKQEGKEVQYKEIPVIRTGQAVKSVEQKKQEETKQK